MLAEAGFRHFRLSIDWARLEPYAGRHDLEELELLRAIAETARDNGLALWISLLDESQPGWFSDDTDGFYGQGVPVHWARYVDRVAELFDDVATGWIPMSDPIGAALRSHLWGSRPPGGRRLDRGLDAVDGMLGSTFEAWRLLSTGSQPVVGSFGPTLVRERSDSGGSVVAQAPTGLEPDQRSLMAQPNWWRWLFNDLWLDVIAEGIYRPAWAAPRECPEWAGAFDMIELVRSGPFAVDPSGALASWPPTARFDATGTSPDASFVVDVAHDVSERLPKMPLLLGGLHVATNDDEWREALTVGWLEATTELLDGDLNIAGIFLDPIFDGFHPGVGFEVDTGWFTRGREAKPSLRWVTAQQ